MPKKAVLTVLMIIGLTLPAQAGLKLNLEAGYLYGDTTYQIGGESYGTDGVEVDHFPLSELKFPIDSWVAVAGLEAQFDQVRLKAELTTDIYPIKADMEDSDWLAPGRLDIYSKSETKRNLFTADLKADCQILDCQQLYFDLGLGYTYQQFSYHCSDTVQYSPSGVYPQYNGIAPGRTINYEIEYHIPYAEVAMRTNLDDFDLILSLGLAPWVKVWDHDDHLRRPKFMDGDMEGSAYLANLNARYHLSRELDLSFGVDYKKIEAEGEQEQVGIDSGSLFSVVIEEEIASEQLRASLGLTLKF